MRLKTSQKQMSESFWTIAFLTLSGGFQDAYSYFARGKVFANAQTGNIVLMAAEGMDGNLSGCLHYLIPVLAFALGIAAASHVQQRFRHSRFHWRQGIVLAEIVLLLISAFVSQNLLANSLVSFSCALQVQAFRKVHGMPFASTMCIGNLRSMIDHLITARDTKNPSHYRTALYYLYILTLFTLGAGIGKAAVSLFGLYSILGSCLLLIAAFAIMFFHPNVLSRKTITDLES